MGELILKYKDGSDHKTYITSGVNVSGWWFPQETNETNLKVAAIVTNAKSLAVGAFLYAFDNPQPEKTIESIEFIGAEAPGKWIILGLTTSDYPVWFKPTPESYGAPDNWGAAAVIYGLIEGLAGIKDHGIAFNRATLSPRWAAAGVDEVSATAKYESSGGYLTYNYKKESDLKYTIQFTGNADKINLRMLLPAEKKLSRLFLDGLQKETLTERVENSVYITLGVNSVGAHKVEMELI